MLRPSGIMYTNCVHTPINVSKHMRMLMQQVSTHIVHIHFVKDKMVSVLF